MQVEAVKACHLLRRKLSGLELSVLPSEPRKSSMSYSLHSLFSFFYLILNGTALDSASSLE